MNRSIAAFALAVGASLVAAGAASAQNLVITGARIITGTGQVIERGSVVVKDGKITSVAAGPAGAVPKGAKLINATGMTVIAGYIDDHRHLIHGGRSDADAQKFLKEQAPTDMRELLESGVTTVQSGGDNDAAILELKREIERGEIKGPRIVASGQVPTARMKSEEDIRAAVRRVKASGADSIAEVHYPDKSPPARPTEQETKNLAAGLDEAAKLGIPFQVHAVAPFAVIGAVRIGAKKLVHSPHFGWMSDAEAQEVKAAGAVVSSCTAFGTPLFDVYNHDNKPTFRDGAAWPKGVKDGEGNGREAGYKPVNGRTLFDNGVTYGYCTDTDFNASAGLAHELKTLNLVFSPIDLVKIMGQNSADFIDRGKDLGTLEVGKLGDIVVLKGNPLDGYWNFLTVKVVIKAGVVMVDRRGTSVGDKPVARAS